MVSKEVRITEEIVVRKEAEQRIETVSDTVRETKVEVEDERGNRITGATTEPDHPIHRSGTASLRVPFLLLR